MNIPQPLRDAASNVWSGVRAVGRALRDGWLAIEPGTRNIIKALALGVMLGVALCVMIRAKG